MSILDTYLLIVLIFAWIEIRSQRDMNELSEQSSDFWKRMYDIETRRQ